jgi:hypothetical protein
MLLAMLLMLVPGRVSVRSWLRNGNGGGVGGSGVEVGWEFVGTLTLSCVDDGWFSTFPVLDWWRNVRG